MLLFIAIMFDVTYRTYPQIFDFGFFRTVDNLDVKRYSRHFSMAVVTIFKYGFTETF